MELLDSQSEEQRQPLHLLLVLVCCRLELGDMRIGDPALALHDRPVGPAQLGEYASWKPVSPSS